MSNCSEKQFRNTHLLHDKELADKSEATLKDIVASEKDFLDNLGEEIRRDTREMEQQISFPNMTANIMNKIEADKSLVAVMLDYFKSNSLAFGGLAACLIIFVLALNLKNEILEQDSVVATDTPINTCIIDSIENKNSTSLVLKEEKKEDPVTIIWVFENTDTEKM